MITYIRKDPVLFLSALCAFFSACFVHPDITYFRYVDFRTLGILFCLMATVAGLKEHGLFTYLASHLLMGIKKQRQIVLALSSLCFFGSMMITNDVSLITFVPLGILVLELSNMKAHLLPVVTLMTIAANLGSMLTPVGNPQNLYLYSMSGLSLVQFVKITGPYCLIAAILLFLACCLCFRSKEIPKITASSLSTCQFNRAGVLFYLCLFGICILTVLRWLPVSLVFVLVIGSIFWKEKTLLRQVDYSLLATFVCLFIFIGNIGRLPAFQSFIKQILTGHVALTAVGISQIISNVPAAILLSGFTSNWKALIIGTNIGGLGTLIASMASLISYKQVVAATSGQKGRYIFVFTGWNLVFLAVLLAVATGSFAVHTPFY